MYQYLFLYTSGMGNNKTFLITETTKILFLSQVFILAGVLSIQGLREQLLVGLLWLWQRGKSCI